MSGGIEVKRRRLVGLERNQLPIGNLVRHKSHFYLDGPSPLLGNCWPELQHLPELGLTSNPTEKQTCFDPSTL
jgi:hypothetical protein